MRCEHCEHEFNSYMFAYRQIRKCPSCGQVYDMKFPIGTGLVPVLVALVICAVLTLQTSYSLIVNASIFILVYYAIDIMMKIIFISTKRYTMVELDTK